MRLPNIAYTSRPWRIHELTRDFGSRTCGSCWGRGGPDAGLGCRVPTLRDLLPAGLREGPSGPDFDALPFTSLYLLDDEFAAEIANRTMHGVMHIGWVPDGTCGYRAQMAVLVRPNGLLGTAYMAAIRRFRHLIVYTAILREGERARRADSGVHIVQTVDSNPGSAECVVNVFSGWLRRDSLHRIARIVEGSA
jgi:Protein of unknown function (DUF2867)